MTMLLLLALLLFLLLALDSRSRRSPSRSPPAVETGAARTQSRPPPAGSLSPRRRTSCLRSPRGPAPLLPGDRPPARRSRGGRRSPRPRFSRRAAAGLGLALLGAAPGAWGQVGLQLEVGLEGKVRAGRWAPVRVTATNSGEPVTGRLELVVPGARTAIPLELPSAAKKRVETTLIPQPTTDDFTAIPERGVASLREGSARGAAGREIVSTQIRVKVL